MPAPTRQPHPLIDGVFTVPLSRYHDVRGAFNEGFRRSWFADVDWASLQINHSISRAGVLRGLHFHHRQVDYWLLVAGKLRVGLADLRQGTPTFGQAATLDLDADIPTGLFIPTGVAHGFYAQTDLVLMYVVNQDYDATDEHGVAWNDPALALDWGATNPVLSARDQANPPLTDLSPSALPG